MGKLTVRLVVVFTSIYFLIAFSFAQFYGIDILNDYHSLAFELCVVVCCYSEGKFHCRYMKYTALAFLLSETLSRLDNSFNFLSVTAHNLIPIGILALGIGTSITLAIRHFYKVTKLRQKLKDRTI